MSEASQTVCSAPCGLSERLHHAQIATSELFADVAGQSELRHPARIDRLIQAGAWTDAALALIELEIPKWRLRRIAYDEGEWHCALSRRRELPDWLDQAIEYSHADLSLAILGAFIDARRASTPAARTSVPGVPNLAELLDVPHCCENFE